MSKQIILFGATGTFGQHLLQQALDNGYEVTAFARSTKKLAQFAHPNLNIYEGDVYNVENVTEAIAGKDIVLCALGDGRTGKVRAAGTANIIQAMETTGVKRLICQTTLGAGDSKGNLTWFWKFMFGWPLKTAFLDHELQEQHIKNSNLDWTIVRPGAFTNGDLTGHYRHGFQGDDSSIKAKISKLDLADFMLKQISNLGYLRQTPGLSY